MNAQIKDELLYNDSVNLSARGAAIKFGDSLNSVIATTGVAELFEQLQENNKPFNNALEQLLEHFKPLQNKLNQITSNFKQRFDNVLNKLNAKSNHYLKFLSSLYERAKSWIKTLFTKSFFIVSRFESPPKHFTSKRFKLSNYFLVVFSSVISPNAPN